MDIAGVVVATVAAGIALVSAGVAWRARGDSNRAATAAEAAEHRASRPRLLVEPEGEVQRDATEVIYRVHNLDGPDLESVVMHRPAVGPADAGGVSYPVATTGRSGFGDSAEIGPIPLGQYTRFTFSIGSSDTLPEFRVKITCATEGAQVWNIGETLTTPRGPAQLREEQALEQRRAEERRKLEQQGVDLAHRVSYFLRGGAGIGTDTPQWEMTTLRVTIRNDADQTVSDLRLVVGEDDLVWNPREPIPAGGQMDVQVDVQGALPDAPQSEAGGASFRSYASRLEFSLGGRRYLRDGDARPVAAPERPI